MKKLTIFIPVYNQEKLVVRALNSIPLRKDIEILIIDDCSTDNTYKNCDKWKREHPYLDIVLLKSKENIGLGAIKNVAYSTATGEYIHELDSDDYLLSDLYEKVIDQLDGTDMVYINLEVNDGSIFEVNKDTQETYCSGIARFIKREFIGDTKCPNYRATQDWFFNKALQKKPHTDKFTNITAYHYNFPREGSLYDQYVKGQIIIEDDEYEI